MIKESISPIEQLYVTPFLSSTNKPRQYSIYTPGMDEFMEELKTRSSFSPPPMFTGVIISPCSLSYTVWISRGPFAEHDTPWLHNEVNHALLFSVCAFRQLSSGTTLDRGVAINTTSIPDVSRIVRPKLHERTKVLQQLHFSLIVILFGDG